MALIQALRSAGYDPYFYDIDGLRPSFEEAVRFFEDRSPDLVGISAVVSTAYAYTKRLVSAIKEVSPRTKVVVGGNLAASAEILLRLCRADFCAVGEGERLIVDLAKHCEGKPAGGDYAGLQRIKGLSYLDEDGEMVFTGYDVAIPAADFLDPDWTILEQFSKIDNYINDPLQRYNFAQDPRSYEAHRRGKKQGIVVTAKGCVARCTFCHRWDKGYRHWSVDRIVDNVKYLMDRYNVGFISFGDENFGSDRRKLNELVERIAPLDILWGAGGTRVTSVDLDLLKRMKESGCVYVYYGMETGSPRILQVMEKNASLEQNLNAARWTYEAGLYTIYQLVLAMPGEDRTTIAETGEFIKGVTEFLPEPPHKRLSINYTQALPGTPVYEYARNSGLIGKTLEEEEKYLISVSDIDAVDDLKFLNFTGYPYLTVQSWRQRIVFNAEANWYRKRNWQPAPKVPEAARLYGQLPDTEADEDYSRSGYFNLGHTVVRHPFFYRILSSPPGYPLRVLYPIAYILIKDSRKLPMRQYLAYLWEYLSYSLRLKRLPGLTESGSLRRIMKSRTPMPATKSDESMQPLRDGR
jgi:radical SAM superfamily enzyme YgiQ (UPF0313 family)